MVSGRVGLITGAAQGVGRALSEALLSKGNKVAMCDLDEKKGTLSCSKLASKYGSDKVKFYPCDVTNSTQFEGCFKSATHDLGELNLIANVAGICDESSDGWSNTIAVNLTGAIRGSKLGMKYMGLKGGRKGGLIMNISSIVALKDTTRSTPVYGGTKVALKHFTKSMGQDVFFESEGVKFITILPGVTSTRLIDLMLEKRLNDQSATSLSAFIESNPAQTVDSLVDGIMQVLKDPPNGSVWVIRNNLPPLQLKDQDQDQHGLINK